MVPLILPSADFFHGENYHESRHDRRPALSLLLEDAAAADD